MDKLQNEKKKKKEIQRGEKNLPIDIQLTNTKLDWKSNPGNDPSIRYYQYLNHSFRHTQ